MEKIAIAHCRVSKGDKEEIENSLLSQKAEILKLADKLGIEENQIDWFIEPEARSSYQDRANWTSFENKIEEACNNPNIAYFLSYSQERFCRNKRRSNKYKSELRSHSIKISFCIGDVEDPDSDSGFWQEGIQELVAEGYSRKVASDTLRGCKQNARTRDIETGYVYHNGGSAPFWLMPVKKQIGIDKYNKPIEKTLWVENTNIYTALINGKSISKTMWEWGKYIFLELRLKKGKSYNEIANFANEINLPISRNSTKVRDNTLSLQAKNECLFGVSIYNRRNYSNNHRGCLKKESEWIIEENAMPALITKKQYDLLQAISEKKARKVGNTSANTKNEKLLVNIPNKFYCSQCHSKIISSGKYYLCSEYNSHGKQGCGASSFYVDSNWLDSKIEKEIIKLILNEQTIKTMYEQYLKINNGAKININTDRKIDIKNIQNTIKQKKKEKLNLINAIASENITGSALEEISNSINKLSQEIEESEDLLNNQTQSQKYRILNYDYFKQLCHNGSKVLTHSSLAEKRAFVEKCIEAVTLDPIKRTVNLKLNINPFCLSLKKHNKTKKLETSGFDTSSEMVAGVGFEPTTSGL